MRKFNRLGKKSLIDLVAFVTCVSGDGGAKGHFRFVVVALASASVVENKEVVVVEIGRIC